MSGISRPRPAVGSCSWAPGQRIARSADQTPSEVWSSTFESRSRTSNTRACTSRSPMLPAKPSIAARTSIEPPSSSRSASSSGGRKTGRAADCSSRPPGEPARRLPRTPPRARQRSAHIPERPRGRAVAHRIRPRAAPTQPAPEPQAGRAAHRHVHAERPECARPTARTPARPPRSKRTQRHAAAGHTPSKAR